MATRPVRRTLMLDPRFSFTDRARAIDGPLAPLAASLAADLDRLLPDEDVFVPVEKARMTRRGGRCERDGAFLEFDPRSPRRHRCPACGAVFDAEEHYRWWIMGYQLWLSERAVHSAALFRLRGGRYGGLAEAIVSRLADRYAGWPNEDNVLGPTRVFFSTYLESIWLLQLSTAVTILEAGATTRVSGRFREQIAEPSARLVSQFNEGLSNRQVWNSAALAATATQLGRPQQLDRAVYGPGGLRQFLDEGLLGDGSWYEGENYHLFAHRGLWYLVRLAGLAAANLPDESTRRFEQGFVAPLRTALPDFTFPARRDSQYRASLRQWRIAESLELGLARSPDSGDIAGGLARLYGEGPAADAARWRSTGEAERNVPGVRLTRADLGWKALLFAQPRLPEQRTAEPGSALMDGQGFGVIRRDEGRTYVALDYGHSGGSHGHPDRLNFWLVLDDERVFEDVGTGSYVERTLHWYRSTLAHNAPLVDGRSQDAVNGFLRAWQDQGDHAWIDAEASVATDVLVRRSLVVGPGYVVDRLEWISPRDVTLDLPMHLEGEIPGADWKPGELKGGVGLEDGFEFVIEAVTASAAPPISIVAGTVTGSVLADASHSWWKAIAPGPPGAAPRSFLLLRTTGKTGRVVSAWSWRGFVKIESSDNDAVVVNVAGAQSAHIAGDVWQVRSGEDAIVLDGRRTRQVPATPEVAVVERPATKTIPILRQGNVSIGDLSSGALGLRFNLAESHYRRTEASWVEAGKPEATITVAATSDQLLVEATVRKQDPVFSAPAAENALDNEHPDTNSDGIQLHVAWNAPDGGRRYASWLMVAEPETGTVRVSGRDDARTVPLSASWQLTATGWRLLARLSRASLGAPDATFALDVIVNEIGRGRERRRGQLVMSAAAAGWAYLRGDRQDLDQLIPMTVQHA